MTSEKGYAVVDWDSNSIGFIDFKSVPKHFDGEMNLRFPYSGFVGEFDSANKSHLDKLAVLAKKSEAAKIILGKVTELANDGIRCRYKENQHPDHKGEWRFQYERVF